jgi:hypothetical protein
MCWQRAAGYTVVYTAVYSYSVCVLLLDLNLVRDCSHTQ